MLSVPATLIYAQESGVRCMGNGLLAVYERKADILQLFGPSYSAPSVMRVTLDSTINIQSGRELHTAVWRHTLTRGGRTIATITDFVDAGLPCFVRRIDATDTFAMSLLLAPKTDTVHNAAEYGCPAAILCKTPAGTYFYNTYPVPEELRYQLIIQGNASEVKGRITVSKGSSMMLVTGGPSYSELVTYTQQVLQTGVEAMQKRTIDHWVAFSKRRKPFESTIPRQLPGREKLLQTIDDVSILLKTQQSRQGGVLDISDVVMGLPPPVRTSDKIYAAF